MATKIAEYKFTDYDGWNAAKNRLYDALGGTNYNNSITSEQTSSSYWLTIWDNCDDAKNAGKICSGNGGEIYSG